jgi:hypothetical protein
MFETLIARVRRRSWREARVSYGPEPCRQADQVSVPERVEAVLEGSAKYLLRDVIGLEALRALPAALVPSRFVKELPVRAADVAAFVHERGLPRGFFTGKYIEVREQNDQWVIIIRGERGGVELEQAYELRSKAEVAALRYYWYSVQPFVLGELR